MTDIVEQKKALRAQIKERKKTLTPANIEQQARDTFTKFSSFEPFLRATTILAYWSLPDELPTHEIVNYWLETTSKRILLPVVNGNDLELYEYTGPECLQPQPPFGILEPRGTQRVDPSEVDLVVVPGVAFDLAKHRLGRGRGYYDRLFPQMPNATRVGVCLSEQVVSAIPCEPHDLPMDFLFYEGSNPLI